MMPYYPEVQKEPEEDEEDSFEEDSFEDDSDPTYRIRDNPWIDLGGEG